jgi:acyl-CoA synthetase (AMP-forming)/AMP-acid ligase II
MSSGRDPCALAVPGATWAEMVARHDRSDRAAVVSATGVWSYRELVDRARSWAGWFDALGLAPGTVVPILIGSTPTAYALLLAGALTGRPLAPLGNRLTVTEIAACARPFGSALLVADSEFAALGTNVAEASRCRRRRPAHVGHHWPAQAGGLPDGPAGRPLPGVLRPA